MATTFPLPTQVERVRPLRVRTDRVRLQPVLAPPPGPVDLDRPTALSEIRREIPFLAAVIAAFALALMA